MNQILYEDVGERKADLGKVKLFFGIILIVFGIVLIGVGIFGLISRNSNSTEQGVPRNNTKLRS